MDPTPFQRIHEQALAGEFGQVDRLVVVKDGYLVFDWSYPQDYRDISRGARSPLGCGIDACQSPDEVHLFLCTFDEPESIQPEGHVYTAEQLVWLKLADSLPRHAGSTSDDDG